MTTRYKCQWQKDDGTKYGICQTCKGYVEYHGIKQCPFISSFEAVPYVQHMISADERFWLVQKKKKEVV